MKLLQDKMLQMKKVWKEDEEPLAEGSDSEEEDVKDDEDPNEESSEESKVDSTILGVREKKNKSRNKLVGKLEPYQGERHGTTLELWIFATEEYFETNEIPCQDRVWIVALEFKGTALLWWRERKAAIDKNLEDPIKTWEELKQRMKIYFQSAGAVRLLKFQMKELKQTGYLDRLSIHF